MSNINHKEISHEHHLNYISNFQKYLFIKHTNYKDKDKDISLTEGTSTKDYLCSLIINSTPCKICSIINYRDKLTILLNKGLYHKYTSSQDYYYTKDLNDIIHKNIKSCYILYKDYLIYDELDEKLKTYYKKSESLMTLKNPKKLYIKTNENPRIFLLPFFKIINNRFDKYKQINYQNNYMMNHIFDHYTKSKEHSQGHHVKNNNADDKFTNENKQKLIKRLKLNNFDIDKMVKNKVTDDDKDNNDLILHQNNHLNLYQDEIELNEQEIDDGFNKELDLNFYELNDKISNEKNMIEAGSLNNSSLIIFPDQGSDASINELQNLVANIKDEHTSTTNFIEYNYQNLRNKYLRLSKIEQQNTPNSKNKFLQKEISLKTTTNLPLSSSMKKMTNQSKAIINPVYHPLENSSLKKQKSQLSPCGNTPFLKSCQSPVNNHSNKITPLKTFITPKNIDECKHSYCHPYYNNKSDNKTVKKSVISPKDNQDSPNYKKGTLLNNFLKNKSHQKIKSTSELTFFKKEIKVSSSPKKQFDRNRKTNSQIEKTIKGYLLNNSPSSPTQSPNTHRPGYYITAQSPSTSHCNSVKSNINKHLRTLSNHISTKIEMIHHDVLKKKIFKLRDQKLNSNELNNGSSNNSFPLKSRNGSPKMENIPNFFSHKYLLKSGYSAIPTQKSLEINLNNKNNLLTWDLSGSIQGSLTLSNRGIVNNSGLSQHLVISPQGRSYSKSRDMKISNFKEIKIKIDNPEISSSRGDSKIRTKSDQTINKQNDTEYTPEILRTSKRNHMNKLRDNSSTHTSIYSNHKTGKKYQSKSRQNIFCKSFLKKNYQ